MHFSDTNHELKNIRVADFGDQDEVFAMVLPGFTGFNARLHAVAQEQAARRRRRLPHAFTMRAPRMNERIIDPVTGAEWNPGRGA
jgi:hypothetical protein